MNQFTVALVETPVVAVTFPILGPALGVTELDGRDEYPVVVPYNVFTVKL